MKAKRDTKDDLLKVRVQRELIEWYENEAKLERLDFTPYMRQLLWKYRDEKEKERNGSVTPGKIPGPEALERARTGRKQQP